MSKIAKLFRSQVWHVQLSYRELDNHPTGMRNKSYLVIAVDMQDALDVAKEIHPGGRVHQINKVSYGDVVVTASVIASLDQKES